MLNAGGPFNELALDGRATYSFNSRSPHGARWHHHGPFRYFRSTSDNDEMLSSGPYGFAAIQDQNHCEPLWVSMYTSPSHQPVKLLYAND